MKLVLHVVACWTEPEKVETQTRGMMALMTKWTLWKVMEQKPEKEV